MRCHFIAGAAWAIRRQVNFSLGIAGVSLLVGCHPEGCYGPKGMGYSTQGAVAEMLVGVYKLDAVSQQHLPALGFTNFSGSINLKSDMTFVISDMPCCFGVQGGEYGSGMGVWRLVKEGAGWQVELRPTIPAKLCKSPAITSPLLNAVAPYGLELMIDPGNGRYVRYFQQ